MRRGSIAAHLHARNTLFFHGRTSSFSSPKMRLPGDVLLSHAVARAVSSAMQTLSSERMHTADNIKSSGGVHVLEHVRRMFR